MIQVLLDFRPIDHDLVGDSDRPQNQAVRIELECVPRRRQGHVVLHENPGAFVAEESIVVGNDRAAAFHAQTIAGVGGNRAIVHGQALCARVGKQDPRTAVVFDANVRQISIDIPLGEQSGIIHAIGNDDIFKPKQRRGRAQRDAQRARQMNIPNE